MTLPSFPLRLTVDEWQQMIAIPAAQASKGRTSIYAGTDAEASYEAAQLPAGGWAVNVRCAYYSGDKYTRTVSWRPFDTQAECVDFALEQVREHFALEVHSGIDDQLKAQAKMVALLDGLIAERATPGTKVRAEGVTPLVQKSLFEL